MRGNRITGRAWTAFVIVGLIGQVALTVEGAYLNLFVYDTITDNPHVIAAMIAASSIAATLSTMVVGAISDRAGRRRAFVTGGYLLWGASMMGFGLVSIEALRPAASVVSAVTLTVIVIIVLDCVVSVFSAGAYSATFMAWVTDVTDVRNRGRAETVLVTLPLLSLLVAIASLEGLARRDQWQLLFALVGAVTMVAGVAAWFLVKDVPSIRPQRDGVIASIVHGLSPRTVRRNPRLYLSLAAIGVLSVATQIYMPYLLIYIERYLKIESYALLLGVALLSASVISVLGGRIIDRVGKLHFILPATALYACGLVLMFVMRGVGPVMVAGVTVMAGFMLLAATTAGLVRDYTPRDRVGSVQGVRILIMSMVPSLIGPFIGAAVIIDADEFYLDLGVLKQVPTPGIFLAAAITLTIIVIPVLALKRLERSEDASAPADEAPAGSELEPLAESQVVQ
jgi:MFS family permease